MVVPDREGLRRAYELLKSGHRTELGVGVAVVEIGVVTKEEEDLRSALEHTPPECLTPLQFVARAEGDPPDDAGRVEGAAQVGGFAVGGGA